MKRAAEGITMKHACTCAQVPLIRESVQVARLHYFLPCWNSGFFFQSFLTISRSSESAARIHWSVCFCVPPPSNPHPCHSNTKTILSRTELGVMKELSFVSFGFRKNEEWNCRIFAGSCHSKGHMKPCLKQTLLDVNEDEVTNWFNNAFISK